MIRTAATLVHGKSQPLPSVAREGYVPARHQNLVLKEQMLW